MSTEESSTRSADDISLPALLRHARNTYGAAIRREQAAAGCHDVPRNGSYVIGAIAFGETRLAQVIRQLRVSKQAAGQLVDTLVVRGYLSRTPDPDDRRRLLVTLTEHGEQAAAATRTAVESVDAELLARVGPEVVAHARAALIALIDIGDEAEFEEAEED